MNFKDFCKLYLENINDDYSPKIEPVSNVEGKRKGYPDDEPEEGIVWRKILIPESVIYFEESDRSIWIISVETNPEYRNQGRAKRLMNALYEYADLHNKGVVHGTYTDDGKKYLKKYNRYLNRRKG
jgi:GNAT superfamily N-acetyltransferase